MTDDEFVDGLLAANRPRATTKVRLPRKARGTRRGETMTLRVQVKQERGEFVASHNGLEARADTKANAVEAVIRKAHKAREDRAAASAPPAASREAAHDGESMGDGPHAALGSHLGD